MGNEVVGYRFEDGLARIVMLQGDQGNAINPAWNAAMLDALQRARLDRARVIVLSARGRFFCVGGDLRTMVGAPSLPDVLDEIADSLHRVVGELQRSEAVVISSVQGAAAGAGFSLAASADLIVAARSASFTLGYTKLGLSVDGGTTQLVHSVGLHRALRLALLNERLSAQEAIGAGLVSVVIDDADLEAETDALARRLLCGPAQAQAATKALLRHAAEPAVEAALRREALELRRQGSHPDAAEGTAAFAEKRLPKF